MAASRLRILVLIQGELGEHIAGPAVRGWEMSRVVAERHQVTAATPNPPADALEEVRLVPFGRRSILREALRNDVVIAPALPPYLLTALQGRRTLTVADQFGPVELEHATLGDGPLVAHQVELQRSMRRLQLRFADVIVSANDAQRERLTGELAGVRNRPVQLVTVPFGLPKPPPRAAATPLRDAFAGVKRDDFVILWWGSIWRWLDAGTALRAFARIAEHRPQAKLILPAGKAPNARAEVFATTDEARRLAEDLGLLDRSVFFMREWIPYERRHAYLQDADLGLVLHGDTPEAKIAARSRYMDYLWSGVPCVLARGDEVARRFGDKGFASIVPPRDVTAAANALATLIDDRTALEAARASAPALADEYRWPALIQPLIDVIEEASTHLRRSRWTAGLGRASASYYGKQLADRLSARRRQPAMRRSETSIQHVAASRIRL
jgi:glycosyltransferase involved in cell wall biosynthesis